MDSPDVRGPVYVYRSTRSFSGSVPANIIPIVVKYGIEFFIDEVEDMTGIFYFVAASDLSGQRYETAIYGINSINVNLAQPGTGQQALSVLEQWHIVSDIWTRREDDKIIITYYSPDSGKNVVLFRSIYPVSQPNDLTNAYIVQSGNTSPFTDTPVPGIFWYYAVIYEDDILNGNVRIRPGANATASAVIIRDDYGTESFMRPIPLPVLTLNNYISDGFLSDAIHEEPLSWKSANMLNLSDKSEKPPLVLKWPRIFAMDLEPPPSGEESALFQILEDYFVKFEWESARDNLQEYLALPRTKEIQTRARFYLGQAHYFTRNYREALWEFLTFRSINPEEANSWINAVLSAMVY